MESKQDYTKLDNRGWVSRTFSPLTPGCIRGSIFTLLSSIIGAGILGIPFAEKQCGIVLGTAILILSGVAYCLFYVALTFALDKYNTPDYVQICSHVYGQFARRSAEIAIAAKCFGAITSYMVLEAKFTFDVLHELGVLSSDSFEIYRIFVIIGCNIIIWFPLAIPQKITALRYASVLSVLGVTYITMVVLFSAPYFISQNAESTQEIVYSNFDRTFLNSMGVCFFAYNGAHNVPTVFRELQNRSMRRMKKVLFRAYTILITLSVLLGVLGYLSYLKDTPNLIVDRPVKEGQDWPMIVGRLLVSAYLLVAVPININPLRQAVQQFIAGDNFEYNGLRYFLSTIGIQILACITAILIPNILVYFKFIGGIFCTYLTFVLPAMLFWKARESGLLRVITMIFAIIFALIGLASALDIFISQQFKLRKNSCIWRKYSYYNCIKKPRQFPGKLSLYCVFVICQTLQNMGGCNPSCKNLQTETEDQSFEFITFQTQQEETNVNLKEFVDACIVHDLQLPDYQEIDNQVSFVYGGNYAVILVGSSGYWNYRHQADGCHAYVTLRSKGTPAENIVMLSYDDAPYDYENPFYGQLYNRPGNYSNVDVRKDCVIDYTRENVTLKNFESVLFGNKTAVEGIESGRVLESGEYDNVFIYYVDHGAYLSVALPDGSLLYADQLLSYLKTMKSLKKFYRLVIYVESCHSGSMFDGILPDDLGVYAVSASNPYQSSWGTYCPNDDVVYGKHILTCLGDLFSVNFLQDFDWSWGMERTLDGNFLYTQNATNKSQVLRYGSFSYTDQRIAEFTGAKSYWNITYTENTRSNSHFNSRNIKLEYLKNRWQTKQTQESGLDYTNEILYRVKVDQIYRKFVKALEVSEFYQTIDDMECYKKGVQAYKDHCFDIDEYSMKYFFLIANACQENIDSSIIESTFMKICGESS